MALSYVAFKFPRNLKRAHGYVGKVVEKVTNPLPSERFIVGDDDV